MSSAALNTSTGIPAWLRLEKDYKETQIRIKKTRDSLQGFIKEKEELENLDFEWEKLIRNELKFSRPDEIVVVFEHDHYKESSQ
jgi:predicted  nucleic acid-binding Zn-ribbon protein